MVSNTRQRCEFSVKCLSRKKLRSPQKHALAKRCTAGRSWGRIGRTSEAERGCTRPEKRSERLPDGVPVEAEFRSD